MEQLTVHFHTWENIRRYKPQQQATNRILSMWGFFHLNNFFCTLDAYFEIFFVFLFDRNQCCTTLVLNYLLWWQQYKWHKIYRKFGWIVLSAEKTIVLILNILRLFCLYPQFESDLKGKDSIKNIGQSRREEVSEDISENSSIFLFLNHILWLLDSVKVRRSTSIWGSNKMLTCLMTATKQLKAIEPNYFHGMRILWVWYWRNIISCNFIEFYGVIHGKTFWSCGDPKGDL